MLLKVTTAKNVWVIIIDFLIMDSNFKILYAFQDSVCMYSWFDNAFLNISDIFTITVKFGAIDLLKNLVPENSRVIYENIVFNFSLLKAVFFIFVFSLFFVWLYIKCW